MSSESVSLDLNAQLLGTKTSSDWQSRYKTPLRSEERRALAIQINSPAPEPKPATCLSKAWNVISWPIKKLHTAKGSVLSTGLSLAGSVLSTIYPSNTAFVLSNIALGYFGSVASTHLANSAQSETAKKTAKTGQRFVEHIALATMMVAGFFRKERWATGLNSALGGLSLKSKLSANQLKESDIPEHIRAELYANEEAPLDASCCERIYHIFQRNAPLIIGIASGISCITGLGALQYASELMAPRSLSFALWAAENGLKGLGAVLGYVILEKLNQKQCYGATNVLSKSEGLAVGFSIYAHGALKTNFVALWVILPIGFFLGTNFSKMRKLDKIESILMKEGILKIENPQVSIIKHIAMTTIFAGAGAYLLMNPYDDLVGYEVFFPLTPAVYYLTRFGFAKKSESSTSRHMVHFLLHKSPLLLAEELNYGLSFVKAHAVPPTDPNARIFFVFQALLFGSTQGALFTIDQQEDQKIQFDESIQKLLTSMRRQNTSNYTRGDILVIELASVLKITV